MYRLTPRMQQHLRKNLERYHELFSGGRCQGWELEELIFKAIQSDSDAQHQAFWREGGHDDKADIEVAAEGKRYFLQIKSGKMQGGNLVLSGYRLGRFKGNLNGITKYLNSIQSEILSIPYKKIDGDMGREHIYQLIYVNRAYIRGINSDNWGEKGTALEQTNRYGVRFSLRPSMSWQIWWSIPEQLLSQTHMFTVR